MQGSPLIVACAALALLTGCGSGGESRSRPAQADGTPVTLVNVPIPPLRVRHYRTRGTYPQVASRSPRMKRVNAALFAVLRADQRRYARRARRVVRRSPPSLLRKYPGVYRTWPRPRLSSASTVVVSVLVADRRLFPAGNDGDGWLSATVPVSTGERVSLGDLFTKPADGLRALAAATRERMRSRNRCVRDLGYRGAFAPTRRRYRNYALTPGGVAVAFDLAEVASPPCGRVHTTVPYSVVEPYLNELGQELVAGVR